MTLRDMTPDELELFEEEIVQDREPSPRREDVPEVLWRRMRIGTGCRTGRWNDGFRASAL